MNCILGQLTRHEGLLITLRSNSESLYFIILPAAWQHMFFNFIARMVVISPRLLVLSNFILLSLRKEAVQAVNVCHDSRVLVPVHYKGNKFWLMVKFNQIVLMYVYNDDNEKGTNLQRDERCHEGVKMTNNVTRALKLCIAFKDGKMVANQWWKHILWLAFMTNPYW